MIKAKDLRVGNFVEFSTDDTVYPVDVYQILETTVFIDNNLFEDYGQAKFCDELPLDAVRPIPLTKEWLVRFGFEDRTDEGRGWHKAGVAGGMK